jgi:hypothetical protein
MKETNQCIACGKYIGLWDREGNHIANDYHYPKVFEKTENILTVPGRMFFMVKSGLVCNRGKY